MIRLLEAAAAEAPDRTAVVTSEDSATYGELLADARRVGAALRSRGLDRFAVVEADAGWVLRLLAGAALVGAEPCQYQPDVVAAELGEQLRAVGHTSVVSRRTDLEAAGARVLDPRDLAAATAADPAGPGRDGAQPLLVRTTGTTGVPKAVLHDWRVLARTVAGVRPRPGQRWLLAYGPQQFAGLQVLQHVLACRGTLVAPFPRRPRDSLAVLLAHRVTCVSATPTWWRFLLAEARSRGVALPALDQVTLGGEAIPGDLLDDLARAFPGARVSQVYASTELGSVASVRDGRPGLALDSLFSAANPEANLRVLDGELWVRATAGMIGYADGPAARPAGEWCPTGDLVAVVGDRVQFRGRTSEVINVGGVKVHPLPVENRITALDSVAAARVFGRRNPLTGAIVAVEIVPVAQGPDPDKIRLQVREAVADLPRAWQPRSITFTDALQTQGHKTLRRMEG